MLKLKGLELTSLDEQPTDASKLDISNNLLTKLEGIEAWQNQLTWLNASHNQIKTIKHLKHCDKLNVLNLGYNKISSTKHLNKLKELNALILNNNELECLDGLSTLKELNTLVVSSNKLENIDLTHLKKLQKVSASHNQLNEFPSLQSQKDIKDLKLNDNKIEHIPDWVVSSCIRIKILDLGNNNLKDFKAIMCLCKLPYLENLNLKGNLLCNFEDYHIKMKELFPSLKILDFKKLSELYFKAIENRSKRLHDYEKSKHSCKSGTDVSVDLPFKENIVKEPDTNTDPIHKYGFKLHKIKTKESATGNQETKNKETTEDAVCTNKLNVEKDNYVESCNGAYKDTKFQRKKEKKLKQEKNDLSSEQENTTIPKKDKKGKKRKLSPTDADKDIDCFNKKKKKVVKVRKGGNENIINEQDLKSNLKAIENKIKKKEDMKKNSSKSKSGTKKSGVVAIKTISVNKSKQFDSVALCDDSTSFGMGQSCAWN